MIASTRRAFLGGSVLLSAIPRIALRGAPGEAEFKLGVATYSLRKFSRTRAIEMIGQLGTPYISVKEFHLRYASAPDEIRQGRREFEAAGLKILSGGNISLAKKEELRQMFDYARAAGMPMIVCAPTHETVGQVEQLVKEYDIRAAIHNHGPEDKEFPSPQSVLEVVKSMDPRMGLCIDVGHTSRAKADIVESIHQAGPRLFDVHMKDLKDPLVSSSQVAVGDGVLPIREIFAALKKQAYQGGVMLEYEIEPDNPLPGMMRSFAFMRRVIAEFTA
jgi:sugar phosphate isomerase/epimerase